MGHLTGLSDIEAEKGLLGYLLKKPSAFAIVKPIIDKFETFTVPAHRNIYAAMLDWNDEDGDWDEIGIGNILKRNGTLKNSGGYVYLAEIQEKSPGECNPAYYAKIIREYYLARKTLNELDALKAQLLAGETGTADIVGEAVGKLQGVQAKLGARRNKVRSVAEIFPKVFQEAEAAAEGHVSQSMTTSYPALDNLLGGGLYRAEFNILAARPSLGKTSLALNIANAISPHTKILFISLETTGDSISRDRLIPIVTNITSTTMRISSRLNADEWDKLAAASDKFSRYSNFRICDQATMSISDIELLVASECQAAGGGVDLLVIDYLQLIRMTGKSKRWEKISEISNRLKALIKEHGLFSLVLAQLNRDLEKQNRKPRLSDLRDSGQIEQDADTILFLQEEKDVLKCIAAKNKNGPTGDVDMIFNKRYTRFEVAGV